MGKSNIDLHVRTRGAKKAESSLKSIGVAATRMAGIFTSIVGIGVVASMKKMIDAFAKQELAEKKLEAAIGRVNRNLLKQASALQKVTRFGDEAIIEAQAMLGAFIQDEEQLKRATKATLDLAAAKGFDLVAAADLVGKSVGSSTNALTRYGVVVTGAVGSSERLETLTKNVAALFGGQAQKQAQTFTGQMDQLANAFGDVTEKAGGLFARLTQGSGILQIFLRLIEHIDTKLRLYTIMLDLVQGNMDPYIKKIDRAQIIERARIKALAEVAILEKEHAQRLKEEAEAWAALNEQIQLYAPTLERIRVAGTEPFRGARLGLSVTVDQNKATKELTSNINRQHEALTQNAQTWGNMMQVTILGSLREGTSLIQAFGDMFVEQLQRIAATIAAQSAIWGLFRMFGTALGTTGTLAGFLGFQHGGGFRVPGQGGPDSVPVSFMASPGERVSVTNNISIHGSNQTQQLMRTLNKYGRGVAS